MKKALFYWFTFLLILLAMTSCRSYKPAVVTENRTETNTETLHDTVFKTEPDTSAYKANLGVNPGANGKSKIAIVEVVKTKPGKYVTVPTVKILDNTLYVDCEARAQELFAFWKSKQSVKKEVIEKPVFIEHQLTFFESLQIWIGRVLLGLLILIIIIWLIKKLLSAYGLKT